MIPQIGHLDFKSAADTNCFITITHADPMDSGIWKCFVAEGVSTSPVSDSVRVTVLHPAELEPIPSEIIIPRTQSETAEIACNATVIGDLEPQLTWLADHREVTACKIIRVRIRVVWIAFASSFFKYLFWIDLGTGT